MTVLPKPARDALDHFRSQEAMEQLYLIRADEEAQRLVAAWPRARLIPAEAPRRRPPRGEAALWDWLWAHVTVDEADLAVLVGTSLPRVGAALAITRGNRLIYPDGGVHEQARQYVRALVARELGARPFGAGKGRGA